MGHRRLYEYDRDSVVVGIIPSTCGACGERAERVRMSLEIVLSDSGDLVGIQTVARTTCCSGRRPTRYPAEQLAKLLDHLQTCKNH
ncbi:hypothetical protein [Streptomyces sp. cg35]|uniref:hypothetical protein n=1 Tax=Streptomyces sp. cg35 TaxID=3421650 RepID=UPI003D18164C